MKKLSFAEVLPALESGYPIRCTGWPNKAFIQLTKGSIDQHKLRPKDPIIEASFKVISIEGIPAGLFNLDGDRGSLNIFPQINYVDGSNVVPGWTPEAVELFTRNWEIIYPEHERREMNKLGEGLLMSGGDCCNNDNRNLRAMKMDDKHPYIPNQVK